MTMSPPFTPTKDKSEKEESSPESQTSDTTGTTESHVSVSNLFDIEEEELDQEGFPKEIKNKIYTPIGEASAEKELIKDLEEHGLADDYKYIGLSARGKAYRKTMPTVFHEKAINELHHQVERRGGSSLLAMNNFEIKLSSGVGRFPDLAVWGEERVTNSEDGKREPKSDKVDEFNYEQEMNPHVILEFSWTNKLEKELVKFTEQMNDHHESLGAVNAAFLIKAVPSKGTALPTLENRATPLCGFNVYELRGNGGPVSKPTPTEPTLQYRVGDNEGVCIAVTGEDLGRDRDAEGFQIPLACIRQLFAEKFHLNFEKAETV